MSRTYRHRPYRVMVLDPRVSEEWHDHRFGACDLPPAEEYLKTFRFGWRWRTRCIWHVDWHHAYGWGNSRYSDQDQHTRREDRRRIRHETKAALRDGRWDDLDPNEPWHCYSKVW